MFRRKLSLLCLCELRLGASTGEPLQMWHEQVRTHSSTRTSIKKYVFDIQRKIVHKPRLNMDLRVSVSRYGVKRSMCCLYYPAQWHSLTDYVALTNILKILKMLFQHEQLIMHIEFWTFVCVTKAHKQLLVLYYKSHVFYALQVWNIVSRAEDRRKISCYYSHKWWLAILFYWIVCVC